MTVRFLHNNKMRENSLSSKGFWKSFSRIAIGGDLRIICTSLLSKAPAPVRLSCRGKYSPKKKKERKKERKVQSWWTQAVSSLTCFSWRLNEMGSVAVSHWTQHDRLMKKIFSDTEKKHPQANYCMENVSPYNNCLVDVWRMAHFTYPTSSFASLRENC